MDHQVRSTSLSQVSLNQADLRELVEYSGNFSDYFMTGVRTGPRALTMMLIPRTDEVETKIIKTSYSHAAGTAHVFFDGARVPVEVSTYSLASSEKGSVKIETKPKFVLAERSRRRRKRFESHSIKVGPHLILTHSSD